MLGDLSFSRLTTATARNWRHGCLTAGLLLAPPLWAQSSVLAVPSYTAQQALQGLYRHQLLPDAQRFVTAAQALVTATQNHCASAPTAGDLAAARTQWQSTLLAWDTLSTVAVGPLLERRSQRQIDFWPTRPALIEKAIARAPQGAADMELVGTPAKGLPALEWLLWTQPVAPQTPACAFAVEVAADIGREAQALANGFASAPVLGTQTTPKATEVAHVEWINQWLGALERLRWAEMEKPVVSAPAGTAPTFARQASASDLASWTSQWRLLRNHAALYPRQGRAPVKPGEGAVPIESLLMGQGKLALASRWTEAVEQSDRAMAALATPLRPAEVQRAAQSLKALSILFQHEVAGSLNIPLGFSDADGD